MLRGAFLTIGLAASLAVAAAAQPVAPPSTIRVATLPIDSGGLVYYAQDMGFYKKAGLDAEVSTVNNGNEMASAGVAGTYDFISLSITAAALAHERGLPFVMVAPGVVWTSRLKTSGLIVAHDSPIRTAKDLNGKTIGLNALANIPGIGTEAWIDQNGGDSASVKFIELPFSTMAPALTTHRIDAAFISEPYLDDDVKAGTVRVIGFPYNSVGSAFLVAGWFTTRSYAQAHPDVARRFAAAMIEAAHWANANHAESARILEKYTKTPVPPLMQRVEFADRVDPKLLQPVIDQAAKYNLLKASFPAADIIAF